MRKLYVLFVLSVFLILSSCKKEKDLYPVTTDGIEISEKVINLEDYKTSTLISSQNDLNNGIYKYQVSGTQIPQFQIGSIIVGSQNGGYLRKVVTITKTKDVVSVVTVQANLAEVFKNGEITLDFDYINLLRDQGKFFLEEEVASELADGVSSKENIKFQLDTDFEPGIKLTGDVSFNPHFVFKMKFQNGSMEYLKMAVENTTLTINPILILQAKGNVDAVVEKVLSKLKKRFGFLVGTIPVFMDLELLLLGSLRAEFDGDVKVPISYVNKSILNFGVEYANGKTTYTHDFKNNSSINRNLAFEGSGQATMYVIPQIYVTFYNTLTTALKVEPYVEIFAKTNKSPGLNATCVEVNAGVDFTAGFSATLFGFSLFDKTTHVKGPIETLMQTDANCKISKFNIDVPSYRSGIPPPECTILYPGTDRIYYFTHNYKYEDGRVLPEPSTLHYFVRDNRGNEYKDQFPVSGGDPFRFISPTQFGYALCVDWDDRESYEFTTYIEDKNGFKSNYLTWILIE